MSIHKLGKMPARHDPRTLKLGNYVRSTYVPPAWADNTWGIKSWGMMLNSANSYPNPAVSRGLGDCTIAGAGHAVQVWTHGEVTIPDQTILDYYEKWDGFSLSNPQETDNGGYCLNVLNQWKAQGFAGQVLRGFVDPEPRNLIHIMHSIAEFGGVYIGLQLPMSAQSQIGRLWDVVPDDGGDWGGHCVYCPAYHMHDMMFGGRKTITCITWGALQTMTVEFWEKYCDESHTLFAAAWQPAGVNLTQLEADLATVSN